MADTITWPLLTNLIRGRKTNNTFGLVRKSVNGSPRAHQGWDLAASVGTTVYAIADGTIEFAKAGGDYGNRICLKFTYKNETYWAFYAHLQLVYVTEGQTVALNDELGTTGKSGNASNLPACEDHLHLEIRTAANPGLGLAGRLSPIKLFGRIPLTTPIAG